MVSMARAVGFGFAASVPALLVWLANAFPQTDSGKLATLIVLSLLGFPWDLGLFFVILGKVDTRVFGEDWRGFENVISACFVAGAFINGVLLSFLLGRKSRAP